MSFYPENKLNVMEEIFKRKESNKLFVTSEVWKIITLHAIYLMPKELNENRASVLPALLSFKYLPPYSI